jgi:glycine cleavage system H protein
LSNVPTDLKYTKSHEWVRLEGDTATVGITDFAQSELGDVVFVELPLVGREASAGDPIGSIESVKTVSDMYAPLGGEIIAVNEKLNSASELLNTDPTGEGWVIKIKVKDAGEAGNLLDADAYKASLES